MGQESASTCPHTGSLNLHIGQWHMTNFEAEICGVFDFKGVTCYAPGDLDGDVDGNDISRFIDDPTRMALNGLVR